MFDFNSMFDASGVSGATLSTRNRIGRTIGGESQENRKNVFKESILKKGSGRLKKE